METTGNIAMASAVPRTSRRPRNSSRATAQAAGAASADREGGGDRRDADGVPERAGELRRGEHRAVALERRRRGPEGAREKRSSAGRSDSETIQATGRRL